MAMSHCLMCIRLCLGTACLGTACLGLACCNAVSAVQSLMLWYKTAVQLFNGTNKQSRTLCSMHVQLLHIDC